jgi:SpoIID/LytB domain protein
MAPNCPPALLTAQTIAARSWLLANRKVNHTELNIDVCNDDCCQRYQGITNVPDQSLQSIRNTYGQVLRYRNKICDARYSKCCGGITESYENVWGGKPIPYLSSISDNPQPNDNLMTTNDYESFINSSPPAFCSEKYIISSDIQKYLGKVDKPDSYYRWELTYSQDELTSIINNKLDLNAIAVNKLTSIKRGFSGRIIKLKIDYMDKFDKEQSVILNSEYAIRNALHKQFLYSSAIIIEQKTLRSSLPATFKFIGSGWGHGVGLCQIGALGMALNGYSAKDILKHYFINTKIEKIY